MPCKCAGLRANKCKCKVLHSGYRCDQSGSVVVLTQSNSLCRLLELKDKKPNVVVRFVENIYDLCAGYNLRYCPIRGFVRHDNYFSNTLKDFVIIMCFLIANFVVFLTILAKMIVHLYFVIVLTIQWVRRSFYAKFETEQDVMILSPMTVHHDYSPPSMTNQFSNFYR